MSYQRLDKYQGSLQGRPHYLGVEYDYEVPDNIVIASPGGVSNIHHHYTKGMYGDGATQSDIYGGEGFRYPYGEHGNLYQTGHNAPHYMGQFTPPPDPMYTQNQTIPHKDNFTSVDFSSTRSGMEIIPPPDTTERFDPTSGQRLPSDSSPKCSLEGTQQISVDNPWALFFIFLVAYLALDFWLLASESFITTYFHDGKTPSWKWMIFYALIFTGMVVLLVNLWGIPLISIRQV